VTRSQRLLVAGGTMILPATLLAIHWQDTRALLGATWPALLQAGAVILAGALAALAIAVLAQRIRTWSKAVSDD
jgi:hypothetical protein